MGVWEVAVGPGTIAVGCGAEEIIPSLKFQTVYRAEYFRLGGVDTKAPRRGPSTTWHGIVVLTRSRGEAPIVNIVHSITMSFPAEPGGGEGIELE